ncbi:MAG: GntR family transcriptional regulator [Solirubrobacteraceae bacterium]|nr:GntR family transcriptional regulator [Solirubrobacteraceae bacterium]
MPSPQHNEAIADLLKPVEPGGGSAVEQTATALTRAIGRAAARPGDRLPSERELATLLNVSRTTLRHALQQLERAGLITRRPGRAGGTFVGEPKVERDLRLYGGLPETLRRHGHDAGARVLLAAIIPADGKTADGLGLVPGAPVYEVVRVRLSDGEPISLERSRFPAERFPGLLEYPLGQSLYQLLHERFGAGPARAVERLEAVLASPEEADALDLYAGAPLLAVERIAYDAEGRAIEMATDLFRGDRTRVVVWTDGGRDESTTRHERHDVPWPTACEEPE